MERVFILWGMADEPTWPSRKPSVASSWPAMSRIVLARLAGPEAAWAEGVGMSLDEAVQFGLADKHRSQDPDDRLRP